MPSIQSLETEIEQTFPLRLFNLKSRTFSYREKGEGHAIILLHGIGSGSGSWIDQLKHLASKYKVIAWDAPGYGGTARLTKDYPKASDYVEALEYFISGLDIEPYLIVGHSFGALIAGNYAKNHAELPALVLANPAVGYGASDPKLRDEKLSMRIDLMKSLGPKGLAIARSSTLLSDKASEEAKTLVHLNMKNLIPAGYAQAAHMLASANLVEDAPCYRGPVLVLGGDKDTITPEAQCRLVAGSYPNHNYKTLLNVGHASYIENSIQFNKQLFNFIDDVLG